MPTTFSSLSALKHLVPMSAVFMVVFMLVLVTLSPNKPLLQLSCEHKCRASMCLIHRRASGRRRARVDLWSARQRQSSNRIPLKHLITNIPAAHPMLKASSSR